MSVGIVTAVEARTLGSELLTPANVGDTVLNVDMADHFDEDGGYLLLNDAVLAYVSVDPDADTITLASPLAVAAAADDFVAMWDAGKVAVEWVADVAVDDGDTIPAVIPTSLIPYFPEGTYDDEVTAQIALVNDEYQVMSQPQREPALDGQVVYNPHVFADVNPKTIPDSTWTQITSWTVGEADNITAGAGYTVVTGGIYSITAQVAYPPNTVGVRRARIMVNGSQVGYNGTAASGEGVTDYLSPRAVLRMSELDVVTIETWQNSGAGLGMSTGPGVSNLAMYRVSV